jgi:hypothetical protein
MIPPRDLLPGNADLADIAARLPRERRGSSWDVVWMFAVSFVLVTVGMIAADKFGALYKEIGVQLPGRTKEALQVWFHLVALIVLTLPIIWRFRSGQASWATKVWFLCAILYVGYVVLVLFMPLVGVLGHMGGLGEQAGTEHR